ncbi:hypothetical protein NUW54_g7494 [Trametes sanguinea]|uniref:Uncharacterized protein n=1 Tax=Trametes sanguinea TaxID=158606 RepID=A0ACC1PK20_9APHY|nr:hypothetical protein NUW54_g7494 [Trametes sanguinea]
MQWFQIPSEAIRTAVRTPGIYGGEVLSTQASAVAGRRYGTERPPNPKTSWQPRIELRTMRVITLPAHRHTRSARQMGRLAMSVRSSEVSGWEQNLFPSKRTMPTIGDGRGAAASEAQNLAGRPACARVAARHLPHRIIRLPGADILTDFTEQPVLFHAVRTAYRTVSVPSLSSLGNDGGAGCDCILPAHEMTHDCSERLLPHPETAATVKFYSLQAEQDVKPENVGESTECLCQPSAGSDEQCILRETVLEATIPRPPSVSQYAVTIARSDQDGRWLQPQVFYNSLHLVSAAESSMTSTGRAPTEGLAAYTPLITSSSSVVSNGDLVIGGAVAEADSDSRSLSKVDLSTLTRTSYITLGLLTATHLLLLLTLLLIVKTQNEPKKRRLPRGVDRQPREA